jgi:hypothetical protein
LPRFRIPDYIALRFNLKIKHIYRGLLLGTGPLVDPGFVGHLSLPLHNLTRQSYQFRAGEDIAWFEFTKTSLAGRPPATKPIIWDTERHSIIAPYSQHKSFPVEKLRRQDIRDYLRHANDGQPIESSLGPVIAELDKKYAQLERLSERLRNLGVLAFLGAVAGIVAVLLGTWSLIHDVRIDVKPVGAIRAKLDDLIRRVDQLEDAGN